MKKSLSILALATTFAAGCADPALEERIAALEERVTVAEKAAAAGPAVRGPAGAAPMDQEKEKAAAQLLKSANDAFEAMNFDETRKLLKQLADEYPGTRAVRAASRIEDELNVIGKDAGEIEADMWYQGQTSMNDGKATLLVFWEVWCPHCKREVPKMEAIHNQYKDQGFNVVGLTKQTRDITEEQVREFMKETNITYPIAKESGQAMSNRFGIKGIPAAAVVKNGKVVWRGHPARVNDEMIAGWIQ